MIAQRLFRLGLAPTLAILAVAFPVTAAPPGPDPAAGAAVPVGTVSGMNRDEVREELAGLLERFPPELGVVLRLDPTLLENPAYLAPYPQLATFVAAHPEVAHQPQFYFDHVYLGSLRPPETAGALMTMDILSGLAAMVAFLVVTGVLAWLVKTLVAQRRWQHLVRVQTEAHNKLLDRFTASDELLAYIESPAGRRFLESSPIPVEDARLPLRAPIGRILGSIQAGVVLAAAGIGLQLVSMRVPHEAAQPLFAIGIFVISTGLGFVASAVVSYALSRRLGLWPSTGSADGGAGAKA